MCRYLTYVATLCNECANKHVLGKKRKTKWRERHTCTTYRHYYDHHYYQISKVKRKSKGKRRKKEEKENVCADLSSCRQSKPAERLSTTLICFRLFPYLDFSRQVTRVPRTSFKSGTLIYVPSPSPPSLCLFLSPHDQVHHPLCELYVHTDRRTKKEG